MPHSDHVSGSDQILLKIEIVFRWMLTATSTLNWTIWHCW